MSGEAFRERPSDNDRQVEAWKDDPWYPAISRIHENLKRIDPNYKVSQIKEKFGELRYYYISTLPYGSPGHEQMDMWVTWGEGWAEGYNAGWKDGIGARRS